MSEVGWIFLGGILAAMLAYSFENFVLEPLIAYRKVIGRIRNRLKFYANVFGNNVNTELQAEASKEIRQLSCDLEEAFYSIGWQELLSRLQLLPQPASIEKAANDLIGLSNSTGPRLDFERLDKQADSVRKNLRMRGYAKNTDDTDND